jgi:hypothetical protein
MPLAVAYLTQGKVRIKDGAREPRTLESPYGAAIHDKALRSRQKNAWKGEGDGFLSGQLLWGRGGATASEGPAPVLFTSVSRGSAPGRLVYSLSSGTLSALCEAEDLGAEERRLWNDNRSQVQHISVCPRTGNVACSVVHKTGNANIGIMIRGEPGIGEVTEGDSIDTAPRWVPGEGRRVVYQSAGMGRNREGVFLALGPFGIHMADIDTAEMETLAESSHADYLSPQIGADGALYYIRRPYNEHARVKPLRALKDTVLLPFRLLSALLHFLNFFSMRYSGKKLSTPAGTPRRDVDMKQMMIWGNMIQAEQAVEDDTADLVPASWQLARRMPGGTEEIIAKGVLAYDIASDGTIAYSNGNAIFLRHPDGRKEQFVKERMIEQLTLVEITPRAVSA